MFLSLFLNLGSHFFDFIFSVGSTRATQIRKWFENSTQGIIQDEEPEEKRRKIQHECATEQKCVGKQFSPYRYYCSKINCVAYDCKVGLLVPDTESFIHISNVRSSDEKWLDVAMTSPIGSILKLPNDVSNEVDVPGKASSVFVKTKHLQRLMKELQDGYNNQTIYNLFIHGNSGVGKTYSLDILAAVGKKMKMLVVHFHSGVYNILLNPVHERRGGWQ